jgi:two-component system sensor histidine kinase YesM
VRVTAGLSEDQECAILAVADNGEGMGPEEMALLLREGDDEDRLPESGIGLRNVIKRVKLATGGRGGVELESQRGSGTTIRIRLPLGSRT